VRFLLVNNHCISDPTAGVTQSLRTIMEWLADAGHSCRIVTTARFESPVIFTIEEHLAQQGVDGSLLAARGSSNRRPVVDYTVKGVPVTLLPRRRSSKTSSQACSTSSLPINSSPAMDTR
jgi:hypothetical protein